MDLQTIGLFITAATDLFWQFKLLSLQFSSCSDAETNKKEMSGSANHSTTTMVQRFHFTTSFLNILKTKE